MTGSVARWRHLGGGVLDAGAALAGRLDRWPSRISRRVGGSSPWQTTTGGPSSQRRFPEHPARRRGADRQHQPRCLQRLRDRAAKSEAAAVPAGAAALAAPDCARQDGRRRRTPPAATPTVSVEARRQQAERLAGGTGWRRWVITTSAASCGSPSAYYFDQRWLLRRARSARRRVRALFVEKPDGLQGVQITKLHTHTVAEVEESASLQRPGVRRPLPRR